MKVLIKMLFGLLVGSCLSLVCAQSIPEEVAAEFEKMNIPLSAVAIVAQPLDEGKAWIQHRSNEPMNPASLMKLLTTFAALDVLGHDWRWRTPVWLTDKPLFKTDQAGVLLGNIYIKGVGDPSLDAKQLRDLLRHIRQLGVKTIKGDIILDQQFFAEPIGTPADFDGDFLRPYNVQARALMLNQRSVTYTFTPRPDARVADITMEPPLAGVKVTHQVPLHTGSCLDWRDQLKANFLEPEQVTFKGAYSVRCGIQNWIVAYVNPASYDARIIQALWEQEGGELTGVVREGDSPQLKPTFEWPSTALAEVIQSINTFSNNTMAQQLFLTLPKVASMSIAEPSNDAYARTWLDRWLKDAWRRAALPEPVIQLENGSGLSRSQYISASTLALLLQRARSHREGQALGESLAKSGMLGTLRSYHFSADQVQLKTGSLRDVAGIAGYVKSNTGKRWLVVAMVNHPKANMSRAAFLKLIEILTES